MSTQPNNQPKSNQTTQIDMGEAIQTGLNAVIVNIRSAQRRIVADDLTTRFFDNAVFSAENLMAQLVDMYNDEVDGYNALSDQCGVLDGQLNESIKEVNRLTLAIEKLERDKEDEISRQTFEITQQSSQALQQNARLEGLLLESTEMVKLRDEQLKVLNKAMEKIRAMDPEGMQKRYKEAQRERNERGVTIQRLNKELAKQTKEASEAKAAFAVQRTKNVHLTEAITEFETLRREMEGITTKVLYSKEEHPVYGRIAYVPRLIAYGISAKKSDNVERPYIASKLGFAFQLTCDMGYSMDIRINEWGMPNIMTLSEFHCYQPEGWVEFMHELIMNELSHRRPELVRRIEWAKGTLISDLNLPISEELAQQLNQAEFHTVFDVVHYRVPGMAKDHNLPIEECQRLMDMCYSEVSVWEKQQKEEFYVR